MSERRPPEIALIGAGSEAGKETLKILEDRLPDCRVSSFARHSVGMPSAWGETRPWSELEPGRFDFALLATAAEDSAELIERFLEESEGDVFDYSSLRRMDEDTAIVVPPVNAEVLDSERRVYAGPNCTSAILTTVASPINQEYQIERMSVSTYQAVNGAGRAGVEELREQTAARLHQRPVPEPKVFPREIAFQVIPGIPEEEEKLAREPKKILAEPTLDVQAHCARVPALAGHVMSVEFRTIHAMESAHIEELLRGAEGVTYWSDRVPAAEDAVGQDDVFVGDLEIDPADPRAGSFWVVGDNLRRGAALNGVESIEKLLQLAEQE